MSRALRHDYVEEDAEAPDVCGSPGCGYAACGEKIP